MMNRTYSLPLVGFLVLILWGSGGCDKSSPDSKATKADPSASTAAAATSAAETVAKPVEAKPATAVELLKRVAAAYKNAATYSDFGVVRLEVEAAQGKIERTSPFSVALSRPTKLRLESNQGVIVCDGAKWYAYARDLAGQYVGRDSPKKITLDAIFADNTLAQALPRALPDVMPNFPLIPPQLILLFGDDPQKTMLEGATDVTLLDSGKIGDTSCYRISARWPDGVTVMWIDEQTYAVRRMDMPTGSLKEALGGDAQVKQISLFADFQDAKLGQPIDPKAFQFEPPADAKPLKMLAPPELYQTIGKKAPELKFRDADDKPVAAAALAGKVVLIDFWSIGSPACQLMFPEYEKLYQKYKGNDKVVILAANIDPSETDRKAIDSVLKQWKITMPYVRDPNLETFKSLLAPSPYAYYLIGADGTMQICETIDKPTLVAEVDKQIESLLGGNDLSKEALARYKARLKEIELRIDDIFQGKVQTIEESKPAVASPPKTLKLTKLWRSADVHGPGNLLVASGGDGKPRIFVLDEAKTIVELSTSGKALATHKPGVESPKEELLCNFRTAVDGKGKRFFAVFALNGQRMFWFDENWKPVLVFPQDALENPHDGIADVQLGDLDGDGVLKAYIGYFGPNGLQVVSQEGKIVRKNRTMSTVVRTAFSPPDAKGRRALFCVYDNEPGTMAILNAALDRQGDITVPGWPIGLIAAADLRGDGQPLWCALSATKERQTAMIGLNPKGSADWTYTMPKGIQTRPIEPIVAGRVTPSGPGQWLFPGCDGSVHIVSADGKPLDSFNHGTLLTGLATVEIDGKPAILIASANGLEAFQVE